MTEYVSKDAVKQMLGNRYGGFLLELEAIPAADVIQLRRGEWKQDEYTIRCSLCGFGMFPLFTFQDGEVAHGEFIPHYCPMCGAQMNMEVPYCEPISE